MANAAYTAGGNSAFHNFHNDYAHITVCHRMLTPFRVLLTYQQDPNERRRLALAEIDKG